MKAEKFTDAGMVVTEAARVPTGMKTGSFLREA
jgi:hypothetical protein